MLSNRRSPFRRLSPYIITLFGAGLAALTLGLASSDSGVVGSASADAIDRVAPQPIELPAERASAPQPPRIEERVTTAELARGESLANSMGSRGIGPRAVDTIAREMRGYFDFRLSQPGNSYRLIQNPDGEILSFRYRVSKLVHYDMVLGSDGRYTVERTEARLRPRQAMIAGVIASSLYGAITSLGAAGQLANDFADVFAYDVDFSTMVRSGDEFRILYERLYRENDEGEEVFVRPGRILAARYGGAGGEYTAVYYESAEGQGGYYRPDGSSVERQFLMAPLRYARVSSRYSSARRHPILKVTRAHHGIDYAAPFGTPVYAVAAGEVIHKSWAGGFGNLVKIRHPNGYVSYYGHLSRFPHGLRLGQSVSQKQVIGHVGSTGLSTGPHVCFRVAKNGRYVNPARVQSPEGPPLPPEQEASFQLHRDTLLASLDSGRLVAADEAL